MKNRKLRKTSTTVSFSMAMLNEIEEYVDKHGIPSFSKFVRDACADKLATNQNVTNVSINDSEPIERPDPVDPSASKPKNEFNFDDLNIK